MSRVLVTGGGGFLGRHVIDALLARGDVVRTLDLRVEPPLPAQVDVVIGSITDEGVVARAMEAQEALVHCAAIADLWRPDPKDFERVNVAGTQNVLRAARMAGMRQAVHVSSYVTLIDGPRQALERQVDETYEAPIEAMLGPYPRSKRLGELVAMEQAALGLPVAIVQPSALIGPGDWRQTPPTRLLVDLLNKRAPAWLDCLINLVDARAVARGVVAALDQGRPGRRYLLTGPDLTFETFLRMFEQVSGCAGPDRRVPYILTHLAGWVGEIGARFTGRPPRAPLTGVRLAGRRIRFDPARAREELGFEAPALEQTLTDAVTWLRDAGLAPAAENQR